MDLVIAAINQIRSITEYDVRIDVGVQQERDIISEQLQLRLGLNESPEPVDSLIASCKHGVSELQEWVSPYTLPEDYLFFIEHYGGLVVHADTCSFQLFGEGPMVEEWYTSPMGDEAIAEPGQDGVLTIGFMSFVRDIPYTQVYFLLDLAGIIYPNAVLGVPYAASIDYKPEVIIKHLRKLPTYWNSVATSFTEFLELAATTRGSIGYL